MSQDRSEMAGRIVAQAAEKACEDGPCLIYVEGLPSGLMAESIEIHNLTATINVEEQMTKPAMTWDVPLWRIVAISYEQHEI